MVLGRPYHEMLLQLGAPFYENFARRPGFAINGVRLLSIEKMARHDRP
jgi:hypothetical protein